MTRLFRLLCHNRGDSEPMVWFDERPLPDVHVLERGGVEDHDEGKVKEIPLTSA